MCCQPYGYLVKPCKDVELNAVIQTSLNKHHYMFNDKKEHDSEKQFVYLVEKT